MSYDAAFVVKLGNWIDDAVVKLGMPSSVYGVAAIFLHKYIEHKGFASMKQENLIVLIASLLFLGGKAVESSRSIGECIRASSATTTIRRMAFTLEAIGMFFCIQA